MAITPGSSHGPMDGITEVELVAAPGAGVQRAILLARIYNEDSAGVTITASKKVAGVLYRLEKVPLDVNGVMFPVDGGKVLELTGTDQSLVAVMAGAPATIQPKFVCSWVDKSAAAAGGTSALDLLTTKGDLLGHDGSGYVRIPMTGADGDVPTQDAAAASGIVWATPSGGGGGAGALELIEAWEVSAAATSHTFSGLDGDADGLYLIVYRILQGAAGSVTTCQPNGISSNQSTGGVYSGASAGTILTSTLQLAGNSDSEIGQCWFDAATGMDRTGRFNSFEWTGGSPYLVDGRWLWLDDTTNITSLDIVASVASGIDAGSYVRLYKLKKV